MRPPAPDWDYLVVTASNAEQAEAYRQRLDLRQRLGRLSGAGTVMVVPDPGGRRVGSGGGTLACLLEILDREGAAADRFAETFERLRILIVHAGGDSKRLPPYGPAGKPFVPLPGEVESALGPTVFDKQLPYYLALPRPAGGGGQVVVTTGDVFLTYDPERVRFAAGGVTGIGCPADPRVARNHGVFVPGRDGGVRRFLQKPSIEEQRAAGAVDAHGRAILDIGILSFDAASVARFLSLAGPRRTAAAGGHGPRKWTWSGPMGAAIQDAGLDLYRDIACAMGEATTRREYVAEVRRAGSRLDETRLAEIYDRLRDLPFRVCLIPRCGFFHFGTLRELVETGQNLMTMETGLSHAGACLPIDNRLEPGGAISGRDAWVEGCRLAAPLSLGGENVAVGLDVLEPAALPAGTCVDVLDGRGRAGRPGAFVRAYHIDDVFHAPAGSGGRLGRADLPEWLAAAGARPEDVWPPEIAPPDRSVWNGRFFPFLSDRRRWPEWLWLAEPASAGDRAKAAWRAADRYSFEEMARFADQETFHLRRRRFRADAVRRALPRLFRADSDFGAAELAFLLEDMETDRAAEWLAELLALAGRRPVPGAPDDRPDAAVLEAPRLLHTIGSAVAAAVRARPGLGASLRRAVRVHGGHARKPPDLRKAGQSAAAAPDIQAPGPVAGLPDGGSVSLSKWTRGLREAAFESLGRIITLSGRRGMPPRPRNAVRSDEIVWGRAPARLDLGGGWTDTPPYALERGGCVINAAVDLNGQPPIQAYARVVPELEIRLNSIDHGEREIVRDTEALLDYRRPAGKFALAKAALALSGFAPGPKPDGRRESLAAALKRFGGGVELTTLAAIPSGSGLGTSSIMGAVLLAVIGRLTGREPAGRDLFHAVLQLEQALTTGGGWQDQIGGAVEGVKVITADPGLVPDPRFHFVPADLLDPRRNGGRTLLYYTGLRRLARNILHQVVGRYLDRDRGTVETLRRLHAFPALMSDAMARRDMDRFGELIDCAWRLNVALDEHHSTPEIEAIRARISPHCLGAKLLGAGGGGFLLIVAKSAEGAAAIRRDLESEPPNAKARFFDYGISATGLVVTTC